MITLPVIKLDTTIAELYKRGSSRESGKRWGHIYGPGNSMIALTENYPRVLKYVHQDSSFQNYSKAELTEHNALLRRSLAIRYLYIVTQRDAFITGDAKVFVFQINEDQEQVGYDRCALETTLSVLDSTQRSQLVFCSGLGQLPLKENNIDILACKLVSDMMERLPMAVKSETQWWVNTKIALSQSGLPTPKCKIISLEGCNNIPAHDCCNTCRTEHDAATYIPSKCTGLRGRWLAAQSAQVYKQVREHQLPFVFKHQQSFGGAGTYLIRTDEDREKLIESDEKREIFRKLFSMVIPENQHLRIGDIILSDIIDNPVSDTGVTFFVTDQGGYVFMGASEQVIENGSRWTGNTINYARQPELEQKFAPLMQQTATWLHEQGYYGPAGADVLETQGKQEKDQATNGNTSPDLQIVDLNVRTTGSMSLTLLSNHFYKDRGLSCAASFNVTAKDFSREDFVEKWADAFSSGRMILTSWYQDRETGVSIGDGVVGAEDEESLTEALSRVRAGMERVRF